MLTENKGDKDNQMPARKLQKFEECDYVAFDNKLSDRVVMFEPDIAFTEELSLNKDILEKYFLNCFLFHFVLNYFKIRCPNLTLSKSYADTHIYLLKKWVLSYLEYKK